MVGEPRVDGDDGATSRSPTTASTVDVAPRGRRRPSCSGPASRSCSRATGPTAATSSPATASSSSTTRATSRRTTTTSASARPSRAATATPGLDDGAGAEGAGSARGRRVNAALGTAGIVLGLAASLGGVVTLAVGLGQRKRHLLARRPLVRPARPRRRRRWPSSPWSGRSSPATSRSQYVADNGSTPHAGALQRRHAVGGARGLDPAVGARPGRLHGAGGAQVPQAARRPARGLGDARRCSSSAASSSCCCWARPTRSRRSTRRRRLRRPGPQPAAAEPPADGVPPADALPRLRRLHRAVRLRHRRAGHRAGRRGLAGRDPALDAVRLGLPHRRHRARRLVELRGARLGRLLGLGPGRERLAAAVAHRHRLPPLGDGAGAAGDAAGLEPVAAVRHVQPHDPRHVPHPLGRARLGARLHRVRRSAPGCSASSA